MVNENDEHDDDEEPDFCPCPCVDCGVPTCPYEFFQVHDLILRQAGAPNGSLCIGCLEDRLGRELIPADFPPLPINDDRELDSIRLRMRKGSGRESQRLYALATGAVIDLGQTVENAAAALELEADVLAAWVDSARVSIDAWSDDEGADG